MLVLKFLYLFCTWVLDLNQFFRCFQIETNLEELKQLAEEKAAAVRNAEAGASDLKKSVQDLSKSLEEYEKEYEVNNVKLLHYMDKKV